jgi:hypothetical protein
MRSTSSTAPARAKTSVRRSQPDQPAAPAQEAPPERNENSTKPTARRYVNVNSLLGLPDGASTNDMDKLSTLELLAIAPTWTSGDAVWSLLEQVGDDLEVLRVACADGDSTAWLDSRTLDGVLYVCTLRLKVAGEVHNRAVLALAKGVAP